jgi:hypothetical protein
MSRAVTTERFVAGARIGDYVVEREVAIEPGAVVYAATHLVLPRRALVHVTAGAREASVQLLREACILEALSHPGIPRLYECGVLADRRAWSAVERIDGAPLEDALGAGPLAVADVVVALREVADILRHAHDRGVVHRRLAASAIVRTPQRRAPYTVCGWDDARALDAACEVAVDPRADIHALGRVAFRALTGKLPEAVAGGPARAATGAITGRARTEPFIAVRSAALAAPAAPSELVALIDHMLAEPAGRPDGHEVHERAVWLCDTLELVSERVGPADSAGFSIRITR